MWGGSVMLGSQRNLEIGADKMDEGENEDGDGYENVMMRIQRGDEG